MNTQLFTRVAILLLLSWPALAQQYYRWVDENGTMHFSESPPPANVSAEQAQVRASHITRGLADPDNSDSDAAGTAAADTSASTSQDQEQCTKVRGNLETLNSSQQVQRVDPDTGETRVMTAAEHQAELERNQRLEGIYC